MAQDWIDTQEEDLRNPHSLATLVKSLRDYLGTKSGINSEDIDQERLKEIQRAYKARPGEWDQFGKGDPSRNYTRLLVDSINGKSNLLFIIWNPGKGSPIHDHANAHCVMKIVKGNLKETVFHMPEAACKTCHTSHGCLKVKKETIYEEDEVAYISDQIGVHHVANPGLDDVAVSLHLYTPPNAADYGYNIYDEKTGRCSHVR